MKARVLLWLWVLAAVPASAQNESRLHRDFRVEGTALKACTKFSFGNLTDCGQTLVMGQPMHIAVGSLSRRTALVRAWPSLSTRTSPRNGAITGTSTRSPPQTARGAPAPT